MVNLIENREPSDKAKINSVNPAQWQSPQLHYLARGKANPAAARAHEAARKAAEAAVERLTKEENWAWQLKAGDEPDLARREAIYRAGLDDLPTSIDLIIAFAVFMQRPRKNYDEAERFYRRALELDPKDAKTMVALGQFMEHGNRYVYRIVLPGCPRRSSCFILRISSFVFLPCSCSG